jgi:hypothetical protein
MTVATWETHECFLFGLALGPVLVPVPVLVLVLPLVAQ